MIRIKNNPGATNILSAFPQGGPEGEMLNILQSSGTVYWYDSIEQLKFELALRREIIRAADDLLKSRMGFAVFRKSRCNGDFWERQSDGGFKLKEGKSPSAAIRDIYANGGAYATECATAMVIVYYKAMLEVFGDERFDRLFLQITLMNWHQIDRLLSDIGYLSKEKDFLPGDRRYIKNPDVDPLTPEWQGENIIDMGGGLYYGHGIGKQTLEPMIASLNRHRMEGADDEARLLPSAGRPNFKALFQLYRSQGD